MEPMEPMEPMKSMLNAPGTKRLKLQYDEPPSNFGFNSNMRRYMKVTPALGHIGSRVVSTMAETRSGLTAGASTLALHSST
jgi:hypothetical protein